uniref:Reticulon n=1 Tax=Terrapene triunguis TaxID=2587831 RepID=A0A674INZ5_9SAUR
MAPGCPQALRIPFRVADLVYWRDTRTSALVFTGIMVTLLSLLHFSIVSVGSYGALAVLGITITLRLGRKGLQALRRSDGANPFQAQLDADLPLSQEQLERLATQLSRDILAAAHTLRRLFLVEDLVDSIKARWVGPVGRRPGDGQARWVGPVGRRPGDGHARWVGPVGRRPGDGHARWVGPVQGGRQARALGRRRHHLSPRGPHTHSWP